ncbi:amino acid kinase family protein [Saccharothrix sp. NRRL B-16314]|uniref:amino acid kinase family protein n=1 Tax=Saccharothrix sp. NRRL B-16314 TaxID=1463825 RepID=UPI000AB10E24|nr:hypothetical protein [Saccharothrix sp. NRRL B-16314]
MNRDVDVLVLKVGGSLVSDKARHDHLDEEVLAGYAKLVADLHRAAPQRVVLVVGGGAIGHGAVRHLDAADPLASLPLTRATFRVKWAWVEALRRHGVPCLPVQVAAVCTLGEDGPEVYPGVLDRLLGHGMLPVLSGDCVLGDDGALHVFGSDHVPAVVVRSHPGRVRVAVLTDVPGVLADGPGGSEVLPEIDPESADEAFRRIWPAADHDTSGAMAGKLTALLEHARRGAECFVLRGDHTSADIRFLLRPRAEWPAGIRSTRIAARRPTPAT